MENKIISVNDNKAASFLITINEASQEISSVYYLEIETCLIIFYCSKS